MKPYSLFSPVAVLVLGACTAEMAETSSVETGFVKELPETVRAVAAPFQNLQSVQLFEEDNCYWYLHNGPVESTFLPLRTTDGRPICVRQAEPSG